MPGICGFTNQTKGRTLMSIEEQTTRPDDDARVRLQDGEEVILALRRTSWLATLEKILTLGLYCFWWRVAWFVVTDRRLISKKGILNKTEIALPLYFVQDASFRRSWIGIADVRISTAGGDASISRLGPLRAQDARRLADTIMSQAKLVISDANPAAPSTDHLTEALARVGELRDRGVLTEDEFAQQKARLLA
jgi:membrane protein YdbS with pleckstrin-like domain